MSRVRKGIYKSSLGELNFEERSTLVSAGLIVEPGPSGQIATLSKVRLSDGKEYLIGGGQLLMAIPESCIVDESRNFSGTVLAQGENGFGVPIFALTDVGVAIASILPDMSAEVVQSHANLIASEVTDERILLMNLMPDGSLISVGTATTKS